MDTEKVAQSIDLERLGLCHFFVTISIQFMNFRALQ